MVCSFRHEAFQLGLTFIHLQGPVWFVRTAQAPSPANKSKKKVVCLSFNPRYTKQQDAGSLLFMHISTRKTGDRREHQAANEDALHPCCLSLEVPHKLLSTTQC